MTGLTTESVFALRTHEMVEDAKGELFDFRNQIGFLRNLDLLLRSQCPVKCTIAVTNLKSLLFYQPSFGTLDVLVEFKVFSNIIEKEQFRQFWQRLKDERFQMKEKEQIVTHRKKNVKKWVET